jgi:hypothetical protein
MRYKEQPESHAAINKTLQVKFFLEILKIKDPLVMWVHDGMAVRRQAE